MVAGLRRAARDSILPATLDPLPPRAVVVLISRVSSDVPLHPLDPSFVPFIRLPRTALARLRLCFSPRLSLLLKLLVLLLFRPGTLVSRFFPLPLLFVGGLLQKASLGRTSGSG